MGGASDSHDVRLRAVVESAPSGLLMIDSAGTVVLVNRQVELMFGYAREELLGQAVEVLVPPRFREQHPSFRGAFFTEPRVRAMGAGRDLYGLRKDGAEVPVEIGLTPVVTADGVLVISSIVDITERKKAEAQRARLEERLRDAHKMEAVGTMAGRVAHDFNNILAAIIGCAEMLEETQSTEQGRRDVADLLKAAERGRDIVQRILSLSRPDRSVHPVDLLALVDEVITLLRVTLPRDVELVRLPAPELPRVLAQSTSVHQVLMNLATNAANAMPSGGRISIALETRELSGSGSSEGRGLGPGSYVCLRVIDTGIGIPAERIPEVFEPFVTDRPSGTGSGLGLAIVRDIMRDHGGGVSIDSTEGAGTTVSCWFPAEGQSARHAPDDPPAIARGRGERILVVDDEPAVLNTCRRLLTGLGYVVETAAEGATALRCVETAATPFELVVTDQSMPGMSGVELVRLLRKKGNAVKVVLLSGHLDELGPDETQALGIVAIGLKPLRRAELAALMRKAFGDPADEG